MLGSTQGGGQNKALHVLPDGSTSWGFLSQFWGLKGPSVS